MVISSSIEKSLRIKHEDSNKFLTKLLSKENSKAAASIPPFRVYYNDVPCSVPFSWELQPGTPKHTFSQTSLLPPLILLLITKPIIITKNPLKIIQHPRFFML
ncbi:hypothetical protein T459_23341 [Capsicum annuum]|uniref:Uncharacterized protein n=1 Tax=Capsicum annuum TaxID=4072 RepID=A0A2G2YS22_CAPAN|nr:Aspartate aminotransferase isoform 1 [Capsicum annuum]PHT72556.1 hypothetical protein T459_23341 [Capsicum annuum]